jgi:hypothetical protein
MADKNMVLADILELIGKKVNRSLSRLKYQFCAYNSAQPSFSAKDVLQYSLLGCADIFEMNTHIRKLSSFELLLGDKLFGDQSYKNAPRHAISFKDASMSVASIEEEIANMPQVNKGKSNVDNEDVYNKYTVSAYSEYEAILTNPRGSKTNVIITMDGVYVKCFKKLAARKHIMEGKQADIFEVPIKMILQIERGMFSNNKVYLFYLDKQNFKSRVDFQLLSESSANEIIDKIRYILTAVHCIFQEFINLWIAEDTQSTKEGVEANE